jgi:hypothetical protein
MNFKLKTHHDHPSLSFSLDGGKTWDERRFCGQSWCDGRCGLPALVLLVEHQNHTHVLKAHSSMVACGPVWQSFRVGWIGDNIPVQTDDPVDLSKMYWW